MSLPWDLARSISLKNFRMSFVPFSITSPGGNSKGLLLIFSPFSDLIKPAIINEKYGENYNY